MLRNVGAYVIERRLIGPCTCRVGCCGRDGNVAVMLPGVRFDYDGGGEVRVWTRIWYCARHAAEACEPQKNHKSGRRSAGGRARGRSAKAKPGAATERQER